MSMSLLLKITFKEHKIEEKWNLSSARSHIGTTSKLHISNQNHAEIMCNSAHNMIDFLICIVLVTRYMHACAILIIHLGLEREFKEISQNLRKYGS